MEVGLWQRKLSPTVPPKGRSLESSGLVNSEAPGCSNRITYQQGRNAYKILKKDSMNPNGRQTEPKIPDFQISNIQENVDNAKKQENVVIQGK